MEIRIPCKSRKAAEVYIEAAIRAGDTHKMSAVKGEDGTWEVIVETEEAMNNAQCIMHNEAAERHQCTMHNA